MQTSRILGIPRYKYGSHKRSKIYHMRPNWAVKRRVMSSAIFCPLFGLYATAGIRERLPRTKDAIPFDFVEPEEFFRQLKDDKDFCCGLGKVMLLAGMLETNLRDYLNARSIDYKRTATLGSLVKKLKDADLLTESGKSHLDDITKKRNYLAHNLYGLFSKELEETILPREQLVSIDVLIFIERVETLAEDFVFFSSLVAKADPLKETLL